MTTIKLRHVDLHIELGSSIVSVFADGHSWGSYPDNSPHYHVIAHRCGYGDDLWLYAAEHEFCHHFIAEHLLGRPSPVLYALARGLPPISPGHAAMEEAMVMTFQRWLRANERPIIGGVDWDDLKGHALHLLEPLQ